LTYNFIVDLSLEDSKKQPNPKKKPEANAREKPEGL
jgi:hypothetical protein